MWLKIRIKRSLKNIKKSFQYKIKNKHNILKTNKNNLLFLVQQKSKKSKRFRRKLLYRIRIISKNKGNTYMKMKDLLKYLNLK